MSSDADRPLNADAIYAAMIWLRDYSESEEGQATVRAIMDEKAGKLDAFRDVFQGSGAVVHPRPVFKISDATKEEIYLGDLVSVDAGIELARSLIWGPPDFASIMLKDADLEDPMMAALSRYVADRAN